MKQRSNLLKVVSILMIIFGAFGIIGSFMSAFMMQAMTQMPEAQEILAAAGLADISTLYYIVGILTSVMELAAGIVGVMYRSKKSVLIAGIIWIVLILINLIWGIAMVGFQFTVIFSLIIPALYFWGWYQSN